jgi:putative acetyltransferase
MVVLIGACSGSGKTFLSNELMKELHIPYLSIDTLKMGLFRGLDEPLFHPMDDDETIASAIWPVLSEMIKTYIENDMDIIIEGCYVFPELINKLEKLYLDDVVEVYFGFSDMYLDNHFMIMFRTSGL